MKADRYRTLMYALLFSSGTLFTQPLQGETWASVKGQGMGHTGAVFPQDTLCAAYNPAGMVYMGNRADIECTWSQRDASAHVSPGFPVPGSHTRSRAETYNASRGQTQWAPAFGINWMICNSTDASFGVTGYIHDHIHAGYGTPIRSYGTTNLSFDYLVGTIAATLAVRFDCQAFGVSALFHECRFKLDGLEDYDVGTTTVTTGGTTTTIPGLTASPGNITNHGANMAQGFGVSIGWMGRLAPWLRAGLAWELPIWQQRLSKYIGFIPHDQRMVPPQRITGGFHFNFCKVANLVLEAQQILWSMNRLLQHDTFTSIPGLQATPFGNSKGPGFGWKDQTILRGGGDVTIGDLVLRAGASWSRIPTRRSQTYINILTQEIIQTWVTGGFTYRWHDACCKGWEFSGFYAWGFKRTMKGSQPIPPSIVLPVQGRIVTLKAQEQRAGVALGYKW